MNEKALISIVIPIYNVENYLAECLESVIKQTYENLEIICVDDKGKDNSINILNDYAKKDSRIKIVNHLENQGLGPARNSGTKASNGEYIFFLDSDDTISINLIEQMYKSAIENKSDIVFGKIELVYESDKVKPRSINIKNYLDFKPEESCFTINKENFSFYLDKLPCVAWNKLYKAEFIKANNIEFIDQKIPHEDEGFYAKVLSNMPKYSYVEDTALYYLIRENSIMHEGEASYQQKLKYIRKVIDDAIKYIKDNNKGLELIKLIKQRPFYSHAYKATSFNLKNLRRALFQVRFKKTEKIIKLFGIKIYDK